MVEIVRKKNGLLLDSSKKTTLVEKLQKPTPKLFVTPYEKFIIHAWAQYYLKKFYSGAEKNYVLEFIKYYGEKEFINVFNPLKMRFKIFQKYNMCRLYVSHADFRRKTKEYKIFMNLIKRDFDKKHWRFSTMYRTKEERAEKEPKNIESLKKAEKKIKLEFIKSQKKTSEKRAFNLK